MVRGKRKHRTSGVWRPGRIRALITNKTYMGVHEFGNRTKYCAPGNLARCAAIVSEEIWRKAQKTLQANRLFSARSAKNQYILRALIKCDLCGRTYIGMAANRPNGRRGFYRCNGAHSPAVFDAEGKCCSKAIRGDELEQQVWPDVETFLRNPEPVLSELQTRLHKEPGGSDHVRTHIENLENLLADKATERKRILGLYRRGRLTDAELDAQLDEIGKEEAGLEAQLQELRVKIAGAGSIESSISSAHELLSISESRFPKLLETLKKGK